MELIIKDSDTIKKVKSGFSKEFPFLKIEFFMHRHAEGRGSSLKEMIGENKKLQECRMWHTEGTLEVNSEMTVGDLENKFYVLFGLSVQVFRKSGGLWLETIVTDNWTLREQNTRGEESCRMISETGHDPIPDFQDFQDWE